MKSNNSLPSADNVTRVVFDNSITVLVRENRTSPVVVLEGALATGGIHDPLGKSGLSSFVSSMMTRGSQKYDYASFNEITESVGANLSVSSEAEQMNFGITCLGDDFSQMVEVLADVLRHPTFPEEQVDLVRRRRIVRLQEREQDTASMAHLRFYETIYANHPYGRATSGYLESISTLQRSDLLDYHQRHITPDGAVIVVAGNVNTPRLIDLLQTHFGSWKNGKSDLSLAPLPQFSGIQKISLPMPDKFQSDIVLGWRTIDRSHPDYYKLRVANCILGVFGMMGRLGEVVREKQGLAYYSYSTVDTARKGGVWLASAGVNSANVAQASESILAEFLRMAEEPVASHELADTQAYLTGALPLTLETNGGVASVLLDMELLGLGLDYLHRYPGLINEVSIEDVQQVCKQYLQPDNYALVVAGAE